MNTLIPTTGLFWGSLTSYVFFVLGAGLFFARNNKSTEDFFFGGRRFSWWLIAMSMLATGVGSHSFAKYASKGFEYGFSSSMTYMNDWFFMPLLLFGWLIPFLNIFNVVSIVQSEIYQPLPCYYIWLDILVLDYLPLDHCFNLF